MQLGRPPPELGRRLPERADQVPDRLRRLPVGELEVGSRVGSQLADGLLSGGPLEVRPQFVQRMLPAIALVGDELLEDRQGRWLVLATVVFQRPGDAGNAVEMRPLAEESSYLEVRIDPRLDPPEGLEDQAMVEHHGGVALLGLAEDDLQRHARRAARLAEALGPHRADLAGLAPHHPLLGDRIEQRLADLRIGHAVVKQAIAPGTIEPRDDPPRRLAGQPLGRGPAREPRRHEIGVDLTVSIPGLHQEEQRSLREALRVDGLRDPHRIQFPGLAGIPPLPLQELGQSFALEGLPDFPFEQALPAAFRAMPSWSVAPTSRVRNERGRPERETATARCDGSQK